MNAGKVLADIEHSYVQRRQAVAMKKGSGSIRTCSGSLLAVWRMGLGVYFFFVFVLNFYFKEVGGWDSFRGFIVPTDSGVGRHREIKSYSHTYTLGVIVAFFRSVGQGRKQMKLEIITKNKSGVQENLRLTLKMKKRQQEKQTRRNILLMYRCTFFTRESTRLPRGLLH